MRLLLVGDFGGVGLATRPPLKDRRVHRIDVDSLDNVLQRTAPGVDLQVGGQPCRFAPQTLDDFHPDHLVTVLPALVQARSRLLRLQVPATFAQAAAEMNPPSGALSAPTSAAALPAAPAADLLGQLLGGTAKAVAAAAPATPAQGIDAFVRGILGAESVAPTPAHQSVYVAAAAAELAALLRSVLQAPAFRALEAAWRSVHFLVSRLDLDHTLQLHLLEASRADLLADIVAAGGRPDQTALHDLVAHQWCGPGSGEHCSAVVVLQAWGPGDSDIGLLAALGSLAAHLGAPLLTGAAPGLEGDTSGATPASGPGAGWQALRRSEVAPWIGMVAPRLLLRLPYGKGQEATEQPGFEELAAPADTADLLWGSGALACALSLGRAFSAAGWALDPATERDIEDLPAYTCTLPDGERELQACAERYLSEQDLNRMLANGLMPLASHRHRNVATLLRWQSVAQPPQGLKGLPGG
jgi:type VI secretion system ImpC/EvpB family protein